MHLAVLDSTQLAKVPEQASGLAKQAVPALFAMHDALYN